MKRVIVLLAAVLSVTAATVFSSFDEMTDIANDGYWAYDAIKYACDNNILQGYDDNTVRPENNITRAEAAAVAVRAYGSGERADIGGFADISENSWYYPYFREAVYMRLFDGDGGYMYPDRAISRQEAFTVVCRLLKTEPAEGTTGFKDDSDISDWAKGYINALYMDGYISGDDDMYIHARNDITRAEFAQLMYNIRNKTHGETEPTAAPSDNTDTEHEEATASPKPSGGSGSGGGSFSGGGSGSGGSGSSGSAEENGGSEENTGGGSGLPNYDGDLWLDDIF